MKRIKRVVSFNYKCVVSCCSSETFYLIGKVNDVLELNNAQIDNDNARLNYFKTLRDYWINYYELRKLTLYDFQKDVPITVDTKQLVQ